MDNLTHTLVGLVAGELVARTTRAQDQGLPEATRRSALLLIGMIGSNLPDSDLLWSMGGDGLGYELHHRGYTHTIVGCVALAILLYFATLLCLRWLRHHPGKQDRLLLAAMSFGSVLLHLCMDALNSYGVHPFWPLNSRWFYGDSMFIVEPLYWLAAAPLFFVLPAPPPFALLKLFRRLVSPRVLLGLVLLTGNLAILLVHRFAPLWSLVPLLTLVLAWLGRQQQPRYAAMTSMSLMLSITAVFLVAGSVAASRVNAAVQAKFPGFQTLDQILTPSPAQPLCWDLLVLQRQDDQYAVRTGRLWLSANHDFTLCPQLGAPPQPGQSADPSGVLWSGDYVMSLAQFNSLIAADCRARESLQFVRAPFVTQTDSGWVLGDLRFAGNNARGLGSVVLRADSADDCHFHVPWLPPRGDLLSPTL